MDVHAKEAEMSVGSLFYCERFECRNPRVWICWKTWAGVANISNVVGCEPHLDETDFQPFLPNAIATPASELSQPSLIASSLLSCFLLCKVSMLF